MKYTIVILGTLIPISTSFLDSKGRTQLFTASTTVQARQNRFERLKARSKEMAPCVGMAAALSIICVAAYYTPLSTNNVVCMFNGIDCDCFPA